MQVLPHPVRKAKIDDRLLTQLNRYPRSLRKRVRKAAVRHPYFADLAFSFPMALFAIANSSRGPHVTRQAEALVQEGVRLRALAHALDLAWWLRRVPPEGLVEYVPRLPVDAGLSMRLANHCPRVGKHAGAWLAVIDAAIRMHSDGFAVWLAKRIGGFVPPSSSTGAAMVAIYAWYSAQPETAAGDWIGKPWHAKMPLSEAISETANWLSRLQFAAQQPPALVAACPPQDNCVGEYRFQRLAWGDDMIDEGRRMNNCLETYAHDLLAGNQVWSVRQGPVPVANLEIEFVDGSRAVPRLVQLLGPDNDTASDAIWQAVYCWLARWRLSPAPVAVKDQPCAVDAKRWRRLWQPYWLDKGEPGILTLNANKQGQDILSQLANPVWELGRLKKLPA